MRPVSREAKPGATAKSPRGRANESPKWETSSENGHGRDLALVLTAPTPRYGGKNVHKSSSMKACQTGITLMELMVVALIIGVLGAVGYPSYRSYMKNSNRTDAHALLQRIASAEERYFSNNNTYTDDLTELGFSSPQPSDQGYSNATVTAGANDFTVTAAPSPTYDDPDCDEILLTSLGERRSRQDGSLNPPGTCW